MKHSSTPAYTIGQRYPAEPETTNKYTPGPMAYNTRQYSIEVPSTRFAKAERSISLKKEEFPGPGSYNISSFVDNVIIRKRKKIFKDSGNSLQGHSPGPGSYNPKYQDLGSQFSMGNKTFDQRNEKSEGQGPGEYSPDYKLVHAVKSTTFAKAKKFYSERSDSPGPGNYNPLPTQSSPTHSFSKQAKSISKTSNTPGPDSYHIPGLAEEIRKKPGKTIFPKRDLPKHDTNIPGPGSYFTENPKSFHSFSIGKGKRSQYVINNNSPGPGHYLLRAEESPGKTIGKGTRLGIENNNKVPGPGSYEAKSFFLSGPKYTMTGRKEETEVSQMGLGPGSYNADFKVQKAHSFNATIGKSKKMMKNSEFGPGPGAYKVELKSDSPGWSFNKGKKEALEPNEDPGPGSYEIPTTIPDIPKYLKPRKSKYSKY